MSTGEDTSAQMSSALKDYNEVTISKQNAWVEDADGKELWLVRIPQSFDIKQLEGSIISLDGVTDLQTDDDAKLGGLSYKWQTKANKKKSIKENNMTVVLSSKKDNNMHAVGSLCGQISFLRKLEAKPHIFPKCTKRAPVMPDGVKVRYIPFGAGDSSEADSTYSMFKGEKHSKSPKRMHVIQADDSYTYSPKKKTKFEETQQIANQNRLSLPKKKKKKEFDETQQICDEPELNSSKKKTKEKFDETPQIPSENILISPKKKKKETFDESQIISDETQPSLLKKKKKKKNHEENIESINEESLGIEIKKKKKKKKHKHDGQDI